LNGVSSTIEKGSSENPYKRVAPEFAPAGKWGGFLKIKSYE
jgi:hypothetical protein